MGDMAIVLTLMTFAVGIMDSELRQLLAQVAEADRAAFARLYDLVSGRLFEVIGRILPRPELAEDALQETFVRIWQRASPMTTRSQAPWHGWRRLRATRPSI